jgi:hypothetical protein
VAAHLADTAAARGRKKRAKTDRADARLQRDPLAELARQHLSPARQCQIVIYLRMLDALDAEMNAVRHRPLAPARHLARHLARAPSVSASRCARLSPCPGGHPGPAARCPGVSPRPLAGPPSRSPASGPDCY